MQGPEYPVTWETKHMKHEENSNLTGEMAYSGTITANDRGGLVVKRGSGHHTTVTVPMGCRVRVRVWPAGSDRKAYISITNDEARGWIWGMNGDGVRIISHSCHGTVVLEYSGYNSDTPVRITVGDVERADLDINKARGMLARCAEFLRTREGGGSPQEKLLADLEKEGYTG